MLTARINRRLRARVKSVFALTARLPDHAGELDPNIRSLQNDLSARLGTRVEIHHGAGGKGKLVLPYGSLDELDGILSHIK